MRKSLKDRIIFNFPNFKKVAQSQVPISHAGRDTKSGTGASDTSLKLRRMRENIILLKFFPTANKNHISKSTGHWSNKIKCIWNIEASSYWSPHVLMSLPRSTYLTLNSCYPREAWAGVGRLGLCWREGVSTLLFLSIIYTTPPSLPGSGVTTRNHFLFYVECKWHSFQSVFKWFSNSITINNFLFTWWDVSYQFYHKYSNQNSDISWLEVKSKKDFLNI